MKRRVCVVGAAAVVVLCLICLAGCYTVLKHPRQVAITDEHGARKSCSDCHDQAFYYHDPFLYRYYDRYSYSDRWYGYYYDPWWYDDYWYYDAWDGESVSIQETGRTRFGDGPALPPPPGRGATTTVQPGSSGSDSSSPANRPEGGSTESRSTVNKKERTRYNNPQLPKPPKKTEPAKKTEKEKKSEKAKESDDDKD